MVRHQVSVIQNFDHVNLPSLLNGYHIKLFPTLSEGFSLALLEAMACGLLPIATDIPGSREILKADQNSIIVPPRSQIEIEKALEKVISNTKYLNELRRNAYSTAQSFSWACVANERVKLYEDYLEASDF
jgi:glycosyltransferase involved in cell wall biosynthesis